MLRPDKLKDVKQIFVSSNLNLLQKYFNVMAQILSFNLFPAGVNHFELRPVLMGRKWAFFGIEVGRHS